MGDGTMHITRWRRYGKDRLYVARADDTKLGFWDLAADEAHPDAPEHLNAITAAVEGWRRAECLNSPRVQSTPAADLMALDHVIASPHTQSHSAGATAHGISIETPTTRPWLDLARNAPGAGPREQATAAREAAPMKTLVARALRVHTDERAWRIGADGEELVAAQLAKAAKRDPRWQFIHAVPVGNRGADIDHLIIGPGGIFTVNTKHHPKAKIWVGGNTFLVDGHKTRYVHNSRYEAARAAKRLSSACGFPVHVEGLIVTVNARDVVVKKAPDGVHVTWRKDIAQWLLRHGDIHPGETVQAVFDAARRSTTWQS